MSPRPAGRSLTTCELSPQCTAVPVLVLMLITYDLTRLLTPLYAIHPANTLACASILLTTRLKRIPLPKEWYILFDVAWDDIWACCGTVMTLWNDWSIGPVTPTPTSTSILSPGQQEHGAQDHKQRAKEDRWRRSWILAESKRAVRKWVDERDKQERAQVQAQTQTQAEVA